MAGKVLFRGGRHPSRASIGEAECDTAKLISSVAGMFARRADAADYRSLVTAVLLAKADASTNYAPIRRKDIEAQLRAMRRLDDDALEDALQSCDHWTLEAIQTEHTVIINEILDRDGYFVSPDGERHWMPIDIEIRPGQKPFLPLGHDGLRRAIDAALDRVAGEKKRRGATQKNYQSALAKECVRLWRKYGDPERQRAWRTGDTGQLAPIVEFAGKVFTAAGMPLSGSRLVELLQAAEQRKK